MINKHSGACPPRLESATFDRSRVRIGTRPRRCLRIRSDAVQSRDKTAPSLAIPGRRWPTAQAGLSRAVSGQVGASLADPARGAAACTRTGGNARNGDGSPARGPWQAARGVTPFLWLAHCWLAQLASILRAHGWQMLLARASDKRIGLVSVHRSNG